MAESADISVEDTPVGFILFFSHIQYSEACAFCADNNLDVLESVIMNLDLLIFFSEEDLEECVIFCLDNHLIITVFEAVVGVH